MSRPLAPRDRVVLAVLAAAGVALGAGAWRGWLPTTATEILGFVTGAACVYLVVRQHIWNFPLGIANCAFFFVVFAEARLFGDAGLQLVYIVLNAHGWYWWLHGGANRTEARVSHATPAMLAGTAVFVAAGTWALMGALEAARGSAPLLDAFTTVLSLAAQFLLNRKVIENWYAWIVADVIYIYLYTTRELYLTAVLYFVFLCLCVAGLVAWRRSLRGLIPSP
jgi:nicotinamide mononucleotide transporter